MGLQRVRALVLTESDHADEDGIFAGADLRFNVWDSAASRHVKFECFVAVSTMVDLRNQIDDVMARLEDRKKVQ